MRFGRGEQAGLGAAKGLFPPCAGAVSLSHKRRRPKFPRSGARRRGEGAAEASLLCCLWGLTEGVGVVFGLCPSTLLEGLCSSQHPHPWFCPWNIPGPLISISPCPPCAHALIGTRRQPQPRLWLGPFAAPLHPWGWGAHTGVPPGSTPSAFIPAPQFPLLPLALSAPSQPET